MDLTWRAPRAMMMPRMPETSQPRAFGDYVVERELGRPLFHVLPDLGPLVHRQTVEYEQGHTDLAGVATQRLAACD